MSEDRKKKDKKLEMILGLVVASLIGCGLTWLLLRCLPHTQMPEASQDMKTISVNKRAVTIPRGCFILVHTSGGVGAFKLTEDVRRGDGGVRYVWFFRQSPDGVFSDADTERGESLVFERLTKKRVGPYDSIVTDAGGRTWIECGPIRLEWSSGDHIYLPVDHEFRIACTFESEVAAISIDDPDLVWCGRVPSDYCDGRSGEEAKSGENHTDTQ